MALSELLVVPPNPWAAHGWATKYQVRPGRRDVDRHLFVAGRYTGSGTHTPTLNTLLVVFQRDVHMLLRCNMVGERSTSHLHMYYHHMDGLLIKQELANYPRNPRGNYDHIITRGPDGEWPSISKITKDFEASLFIMKSSLSDWLTKVQRTPTLRDTHIVPVRDLMSFLESTSRQTW